MMKLRILLMISEYSLLIAFFMGIVLGLRITSKKPKTYIIKEFSGINKKG